MNKGEFHIFKGHRNRKQESAGFPNTFEDRCRIPLSQLSNGDMNLSCQLSADTFGLSFMLGSETARVELGRDGGGAPRALTGPC